MYKRLHLRLVSNGCYGDPLGAEHVEYKGYGMIPTLGLKSSCQSNILDYEKQITAGIITRWNPGVVCPVYSDSLAYESKIIDTSIPLEELRIKHDVSVKIRAWNESGNFSEYIRN